jgi:hypothetical protein
MCHPTPAQRFFQQAIPNACPAKNLAPAQRQTIGLHALAGNQSITGLADQFDVSRRFVYRQANTAKNALDDAFADDHSTDDKPLVSLSITKQRLRQIVLGLLLICHSSYRGVLEFCRDLLGISLSLGTVHNIVQDAIAKARPYNRQHDLSSIAIAGLDEIYQNGQPVLVGADIASTYCFLLSREEHADADTWGVRLLEAKEQGLDPQAAVADFGPGLRAGHSLAFPDVPCRGDLFHALAAFNKARAALEKRAYDALDTQDKLQRKKAKLQKQAQTKQRGTVHSLCLKAAAAAKEAARAMALADDLTLLTRWLREDVFAVSGLTHADRRVLFDFVLGELQARLPLAPQQLGPLSTLMNHQGEALLAFAASLDQEVAALAATYAVPDTVVRAMLDLQTGSPYKARHWQNEATLRQRLHGRFYLLQEAVQTLAQGTVRASSIIENINSRLRTYFTLRREIGSEYLELLQFFLNHRRFARSERRERVGKSPAELMSGQTHGHWLELLGYQRFSAN